MISSPNSKILNGLKWSTITQVAVQLILFVLGIVLARLLSPLDYGLIGMVLVFTGFASIFVDMGLGSALIQKKEIEPRHINTVFFVNLGVSIFLATIMLLGANYISLFYNEVKLKPIAQVLSLNFILTSLSSVQRSLLSKSLDFKKISKVDISTSILSGVICIILAYMGFGVWSLVLNYIISSALSAIFVWIISPWKPVPQFDKLAFKELFGYSSNLLGFGILNYWVRNLDNLLVGKFIGTSALGVYSRAYTLMLLPITQITAVITKVMFPALSAIQDDVSKVRSIYIRSITIIAFVTFPMMIGLLIVADSFILSIYGDKWVNVVPILQVLCVVGLVQSITTTVGWIFNSQGKTKVQLRWALFTSTFRCISFFVGIQWGVMGVAMAYMLGTLMLSVPSLFLAGRIIKLQLRDIFDSLLPTTLISVVMGLGVYGVKLMLINFNLSPIIVLLLLIVTGVTIYIFLSFLFKIKPLIEVNMIFTKMRG
ncbi:MOP flippase family protein [Nibribacter koreensis]